MSPPILVSLVFPLPSAWPLAVLSVALVPVAPVYPSEEARRWAAQTRTDGTTIDASLGLPA